MNILVLLKLNLKGSIMYSKDNPFCINNKPITQFQEEAKRWETDKEGWIAEWRSSRRGHFWLIPTWLQEFEKEDR